MTYKESYKQCNTIDELKQTEIAIFLGANPDRIRAIENAMNERANEIEKSNK